MAKTNKSLVLSAEEEAFILALRNLLDSGVTEDDEEPDEVEDDVEEDEDDEEEAEPLDRDEVSAMAIKDLRALAKDYLGDDAPTKKADILEALEDYFVDDEEEDEDDEDEEDVEDVEDEDEDEEEGEYDRDELAEMSLKDLRALAKEEGHSAADYRGLDQDALIDLIMGEDDEDEDDEDEEEDEEVEELDEDALKAMTHKELTALAKELEIKVPTKLKKDTKANKTALVNLILDSGEDEE